MAYLFLYGTGGWTQRWQIPAGEEQQTRAEIARVGHDGTGHLTVIESTTSSVATLVVAWQSIAAAVVVDAADASAEGGEVSGHYA